MSPTPSSGGRTDTAYVGSMVALLVVTLVGFLMIALGWRSIARTTLVDLQLPGLVSGSVGGLLLVVVGAGLAVGLHARRAEAAIRSHTETVLVEARRLAEAITSGGAGP